MNKLRQAEVELGKGKSIGEVGRHLSISEPTSYARRRECGRLNVDQAKRFKELEQENAGLKRLLAEAALDKAILREAARCPARAGRKRAASCEVLGQARSVQRHTPRVRDDEDTLTGRIVEPAAVSGRYCTPRITAMLHSEGWHVNHKRVERIWRREKLKVPKKQPKRGRLWLNNGSCVRLRPEHKDRVWAYDFASARTHDGLPLRLLVIVDEFTRECLSTDVARQLTSDDVLERLAWLMATRGVPEHLRSDNGPR